ncbi:amidohydrolase [Rhizobium sp. AC44/96]|uniref:amidohydrolase family protein n=1 Tax=unclassified Rhizobium TaxID=2613769 RepID=UPI00080FC473|nr:MULTISPECIES: amidohydrolase family protein [unclassified Rhizobium]MDM9621895.1 amidohydrolase family protein [Rhizobium sp. S96]OCJ17178.1 amidohydrolase [Rhizobium sp. AC44/96]
MNPDILITNGRVVPGDGATVLDPGSVRIRGDQIIEVGEGRTESRAETFVIDAAGHTVIPGIINAHAHGCVFGPSMPSGSPPFTANDIEYFRNRHLISGTTTLLNVCGLALPAEIDRNPPVGHPLDIHVTTAHTPSNIQAALAIDGKGLRQKHRSAAMETMIDRGAKALGEAGGGQTLGGGAQDYRFIPEAVFAATGTNLPPKYARALKEAILGRSLTGEGARPDDIPALLADCGLAASIRPEEIMHLIKRTVMPPVKLSLQGLEEIAAASERYDLPGIFHHALPTAQTLIRLAETYPRARMVAAHANHPSFEPEECASYARQLREHGTFIDVSTLDCISTRWRNDPTNFDRLIEEGLVDTLSTDFAGGDWDSILDAIQRIVKRRMLVLPQAIALATGNVARVFPELAGDRGRLENGKRADLAIVENHNLARVRHVLIRGRVVVFNGARIGSSHLSDCSQTGCAN